MWIVINSRLNFCSVDFFCSDLCWSLVWAGSLHSWTYLVPQHSNKLNWCLTGCSHQAGTAVLGTQSGQAGRRQCFRQIWVSVWTTQCVSSLIIVPTSVLYSTRLKQQHCQNERYFLSSYWHESFIFRELLALESGDLCSDWLI